MACRDAELRRNAFALVKVTVSGGPAARPPGVLVQWQAQSLWQREVMSSDVQAGQDAEGGWTFHFGDPVIIQLQVDYRFSLVLSGALIVLESPFEMRTGDGTVRVQPGVDMAQVGQALSLFDARVEAVRAAPSGDLRIDLADEIAVTVSAATHHENWQIVKPDGEQWIGLPGGVAHFPAR